MAKTAAERGMEQMGFKAAPVGPLAVYSGFHWAILQAMGYTWSKVMRRGVRMVLRNPAVYVVALVKPGDPAYQGVA